MTITSEILMINLPHIWPMGAPSNWHSCPTEIPAASLKTSLHKIFQVHFKLLCSNPVISHLSKKLGFLVVENRIKKPRYEPVMNSWPLRYCCSQASSPSLWTKKRRHICMHINIHAWILHLQYLSLYMYQYFFKIHEFTLILPILTSLDSFQFSPFQYL